MANWTHVNGIFRINCCRGIEPKPNFYEIFGKQCLYDDPSELHEEMYEHPERFLPSSYMEQSCHISVWEDPVKCNAAAYTVSIFGDLRGHDTTTEIIDYFKKVCDKIGRFHIRQAVMTAENEWSKTVQTATYVDGEIKIETYKKEG